MHIRAIWQFYKDTLLFNLVFSILCKVFFGFLIASIIFLSLGFAVGFLAFNIIKKEEFYFYFNLGLTKWRLFKIAFILNFIFGLPVLLFIFLIITLLFGNLKLI